MSNDQYVTRCIFPTEIILDILYNTDPRDILHWRTVSKWFCAITHDPTFWRILYVNSHFMRPPGPFPSRSIASLERALVRSAQLAQSWTTQCLQTMTPREIPFDGRRTRRFQKVDLICGRWLIVCQSARRFVSYDTDTNPKTRVPQILWEEEERIDHWDLCSMMSEEGQCIVYVLYCQRLSDLDTWRWKFFEFHLDGESGMLCRTISLCAPRNSFASMPQDIPNMEGGPSRFIFFEMIKLVFDTQTRVFCKFPEFSLALDETRLGIAGRSMPHMLVGLTKTHVFAFSVYSRPRGERRATVIQVFTVPDDQPPGEDGYTVLRLTHEAISFELEKAPHSIIRDSVVDPVNGTTHIRFLDGWITLDNNFDPRCMDVTLPKPSPVGVLPMAIRWHAVIARDKPLHRKKRLQYSLLDCPGDGYARGLITTTFHYPFHGTNEDRHEKRRLVVKFMIDATGDDCVTTLSEFSPPPAEWEHDGIQNIEPRSTMRLDGIRGAAIYYNGRFKQRGPPVLVMTDVK